MKKDNTTEAGGTQQYYTMAMGQKWVQDSDGNTLLRSVVVAGSTTMLVQSFLESSTFDNRDYMNDMFLYLTDYSASSNKVTSARIQTNVSDITGNACHVQLPGILGVYHWNSRGAADCGRCGMAQEEALVSA